MTITDWKQSIDDPYKTIIAEDILPEINTYQNDIGFIVLYGSVAEGTATIDSDFDIWCYFTTDYTKAELKDIQDELDDSFHLDIDVHLLCENHRTVREYSDISEFVFEDDCYILQLTDESSLEDAQKYVDFTNNDINNL